MTFVVLLWCHGGKGRPFDTISDDLTRFPNAYALNYLENHHKRLFEASTLIKTEQELKDWTSSILFPTVTANSPLLVPVEIAKTALGWSNFNYISGENE